MGGWDFEFMAKKELVMPFASRTTIVLEINISLTLLNALYCSTRYLEVGSLKSPCFCRPISRVNAKSIHR